MTHLRQLKCFESRPAATFVPDQDCEAGGLNLLWQPGSLAAWLCEACKQQPAHRALLKTHGRHCSPDLILQLRQGRYRFEMFERTRSAKVLIADLCCWHFVSVFIMQGRLFSSSFCRGWILVEEAIALCFALCVMQAIIACVKGRI
jgi:hypothetical protein